MEKVCNAIDINLPRNLSRFYIGRTQREREDRGELKSRVSPFCDFKLLVKKLKHDLKSEYCITMKTIQELNSKKVPIVRIDPSLEKYVGQSLFPQKLAKANEMLKTAKLPTRK